MAKKTKTKDTPSPAGNNRIIITAPISEKKIRHQKRNSYGPNRILCPAFHSRLFHQVLRKRDPSRAIERSLGQGRRIHEIPEAGSRN